MRRFWRVIALLVMSSVFLSGCLNGLWSGATLLYDRHNVYKKISDYQLFLTASHALREDNLYMRKDASVEIAVFNGDLLLVGYVPSLELRNEAQKRVGALSGCRRLFNQLSIRSTAENPLQDSWITGEIRSQIFMDSAIDPSKFKVITADQIVYLMGDVDPAQANLVISIARQCAGVKRVVKLFKYLHLTDSST